MAENRITLGRLVDSLMSIHPDNLSPARLKKEIGRQPLDLGFILEKDRPCPILYTRNLVLKNQNLEVLLVNWGPGQMSPIHDHGTSFGAVLTLKGELSCTTYQVQGDPQRDFSLKEMATQTYGPGDIGITESGDVHKQGNAANKDQVVSLHFYIHPLEDMYVYNSESGTREKADLHYCLGEATCQYVIDGGKGPCTRS